MNNVEALKEYRDRYIENKDNNFVDYQVEVEYRLVKVDGGCDGHSYHRVVEFKFSQNQSYEKGLEILDELIAKAEVAERNRKKQMLSDMEAKIAELKKELGES